MADLEETLGLYGVDLVGSSANRANANELWERARVSLGTKEFGALSTGYLDRLRQLLSVVKERNALLNLMNDTGKEDERQSSWLREMEVLEALAMELEDRRPFQLTLGDALLETGDPDAAFLAYEAAVDEEPDPTILGEIGCCLLQRCRVAALPTSGRVSFEDGVVDIDSSMPRDAGPEFPESTRLLKLAVRAFGLAWLHCYQFNKGGGPSVPDFLHGVFALDGLRLTFIELDDLDASSSVCVRYRGWVEDWTRYEEVYEFLSEGYEETISKTMAYLLGARAHISPGPSLEQVHKSQQYIIWQLNQVTAQSQNGQLDEKALERIERLIRDLLRYDIGTTESRLRQTFGQDFDDLPQSARKMLTEAEGINSIFVLYTGADWSLVALQFSKSLEILLRNLGSTLDKASLRNFSFAKANITEFPKLFNEKNFAQHAELKGIPKNIAEEMAKLGPGLERVVDRYRNPAAHGAKVLSRDDVKDLRESLLGKDGLIWRISRLVHENA